MHGHAGHDHDTQPDPRQGRERAEEDHGCACRGDLAPPAHLQRDFAEYDREQLQAVSMAVCRAGAAASEVPPCQRWIRLIKRGKDKHSAFIKQCRSHGLAVLQ